MIAFQEEKFDLQRN